VVRALAFLGADFEYATHTLLNLHLAGAGQPVAAKDLAAFQKIPHPFVRKVLTRLEHAGLVAAEEGRRGGWRLRVPAESITLLAVADALRSTPAFFTCRQIRARCALWQDEHPPAAAVTGVCAIHAAVLVAERAMREQLARQTIAGLARHTRERYPTYALQSLPRWFSGQTDERARAASSVEPPR
jgi:Rrf2 family protein